AGQLVWGRGQPGRAQQVVAKGGVGGRRRRRWQGIGLGHLEHAGGGVAVVLDGVAAAEALGADDLLAVERTVGSPERHVALGGHLTETVITRGHGAQITPVSVTDRAPQASATPSFPDVGVEYGPSVASPPMSTFL